MIIALHYDAVAAFLDIVAIYLFYGRKNLRNRASRSFGVILWMAFGYAVFSLLSCIIASWGTAALRSWPLEAALAACFAFHSLIPPAASLFILSSGGKAIERPLTRAAAPLPLVASLAIVFSSPWTGLVFSVDSGGGFHCGPLRYPLYLLGLVYFIYALARSYGKSPKASKTSKTSRSPFPLLIVLPLVAAIASNLTGLTVPLESFAISIDLLIILFTFQDSSQLVDRETGLLNRRAFQRELKTRLSSGRPFDLILIRGKDVGKLLYLHSSSELFTLLRDVAGYLTAKAGSPERVFSLEDARFALLPSGAPGDAAHEALMAEISERFSHDWRLAKGMAAFQARLCLLRCPEEAAAPMDVLDCLEEMGAREEKGGRANAIKATDLNLVGGKREAVAERSIVGAIESDRVGVLYQPLYSVAEKRFSQIDAHLFLSPPGEEPFSQRELIRVAERSGLMYRLGFLGLKTIAGFYAKGGLEARGVSQVQIRLSAVQCLRSDLPQQVLAVTESLGLDPARLCFEITEEAATHSPEAMALNIRLLSSQGVSFALDDYGSGYTDLGYIMELPFNSIKLDKSVIRHGFESDKGRIIMESTIALLRRLGRKIVAEGVETDEQAAVLSAIGCDYLQGFHYSPPLEAERLQGFLAGKD